MTPRRLKPLLWTLPLGILVQVATAPAQWPQLPALRSLTTAQAAEEKPPRRREITRPVYLIAYEGTKFEHGEGGHGEDAFLKEIRPRWEAAQERYLELLGTRDLTTILGLDAGGDESGVPLGLAKSAVPWSGVKSVSDYLDLERATLTLNGLTYQDGEKLIQPILTDWSFYSDGERFPNRNPTNLIEISRYEEGKCVLVATLLDESGPDGKPDSQLDTIVLEHPYPVLQERDADGRLLNDFIRGYGLRSASGFEKVLLPLGYKKIKMAGPEHETITIGKPADYQGFDKVQSYFSGLLSRCRKAEQSLHERRLAVRQ